MVELPKVRRERQETAPLEEISAYTHQEDGFGWAVSYADVLMVLLSFFIVFFSFSDKDRNSVLEKILLTESDKKSGPQKTNERNVNAVGQTEEANIKLEPVLAKLDKLLIESKIEKVNHEDRITLMLPENVYKPGSVDLNKKYLKLLTETLQRISIHKNEIEITFVGHSDNKKVSKSKTETIRNNFDLSSIRATRAQALAGEMGFPLNALKSKAEGEFSRESRTLSIQIGVRGKL